MPTPASNLRQTVPQFEIFLLGVRATLWGSSYLLIKMALDGMISFSNRPLYISIGAGLLLSAASSLYGSFLIGRYLINPGANAVEGWLSTVTLTTFIGGLILLNQGVLGIYLGRLYNQAKGRPLYVVDKVMVGALQNTSTSRTTEHG